MPTWDKKTRSFKGRVRISGHPQATRTGFKTKDSARLWELKTKEALKNNLAIPDPETRITFSGASTEYLNFCTNHQYAQGTIDTKSQIFRNFIKNIKHDPFIEDVNQDLIESYLNTKERSKTANRHLRELKTLFNWLMKKEYVDFNPCLKIEKYREKKYYPYVPPAEDVNKVLLVADEFEYDFLQTIYHLAARRKEVLTLKWDDVDFKNKTVGVWTRKRQGGELERDTLKMNSVLEGILKEREKGKTCELVFHFKEKEIPRTKIEKMVGRLCKKAKVKKFGFHAIRHHVSALMMSSKKLSLVDIQRQLRHKSATTTDHYLTGLVNESNAADVIEEMQTGKTDSNIVPIRQKK